MKKKEQVFKYLLKKRVAVNISFIVKGKKPELAEREVDSFIKKTITNRCADRGERVFNLEPFLFFFELIILMKNINNRT